MLQQDFYIETYSGPLEDLWTVTDKSKEKKLGVGAYVVPIICRPIIFRGIDIIL